MIDTIVLAGSMLYRRPKWAAYDPGWLVEAAEREHPDQPWLAAALSRCTRARWESRAYVHFVAPDRPNRLGSEWQFERSLMLEDTAHGTIILDILRGGRVGGAEFLSRLLDR
ncbi:hypothetical protein [Tahibacter caeni]|uniref:hypothetical protein n=1 Tax=Tahibacter caeni TaxID=1453545 RepID=UPI0021488CC1|nr:hypothetical protein [Tahibacter caeni]